MADLFELLADIVGAWAYGTLIIGGFLILVGLWGGVILGLLKLTGIL